MPLIAVAKAPLWIVFLILAVAPALVYSRIPALMLLGVTFFSLAGPLTEILYCLLSRMRPGDLEVAGVFQSLTNILMIPITWLGGFLYKLFVIRSLSDDNSIKLILFNNSSDIDAYY
ncbi:MAG: hypothetical protein QXR44_06545 [Thermoproteota archaeon]